jgi:hypothetical protein
MGRDRCLAVLRRQPAAGGSRESGIAPLRTSGPAACRELADPPAGHRHAFGAQQILLEAVLAAEAADPSSGRDDAVAGEAGDAAAAHDRADRPCGPRAANRSCDVAVGCHPAGRNAAYDCQHPPRERGQTLDTHLFAPDGPSAGKDSGSHAVEPVKGYRYPRGSIPTSAGSTGTWTARPGAAGSCSHRLRSTGNGSRSPPRSTMTRTRGR